MKRFFFYVWMILGLVGMSAVFVSCDDDDEGKEASSALVGYWCAVDKDYSYDGDPVTYYEIVVFESNGTFQQLYWDTQRLELDEEYGTYTYNVQTKQLTTNTLVGEKPGKYTLTARISGTTLMMLEPDGDSYSYERITYLEYQELMDRFF